ncbi:MAG: Carbonic anhydrase, gamma class [uncultured Thermomicrobiales bacterium]|uniref:Carbonic anhydrase, gamma class n=1 Tax=uncultured Thermomicrobiales bacterium TaxID=1645740 RepID=A0A6J4UFZ8_9BACT|nr:MAG: Carbonic anhydrase, gamma class [uncultured Thermomicrobiales bacterium]
MANFAERSELSTLFPGAIILPFRGMWPQVDRSAFIAPGAVVVGSVTIGEASSVWFQAVVRGDIAPIAIGDRTSVQDGTVVHVNADAPVRIGNDVTIGHGALIHGTTIGDRVLVGMGAIVLSYSTIGANAVIAAGALISERVHVAEGAVMVGLPAKQRDQLDAVQQDRLASIPARYVSVRQEYLDLMRSGDDRET